MIWFGLGTGGIRYPIDVYLYFLWVREVVYGNVFDREVASWVKWFTLFYRKLS